MKSVRLSRGSLSLSVASWAFSAQTVSVGKAGAYVRTARAVQDWQVFAFSWKVRFGAAMDPGLRREDNEEECVTFDSFWHAEDLTPSTPRSGLFQCLQIGDDIATILCLRDPG